MLNLFKLNYHPQLVNMMAKSIYAGTFSVNILTPWLIAYILNDSVDTAYIGWWLGLNLIIFIARISIGRKFKAANIHIGDVNSLLNAMILVISLSALLHAYALWYLSLYVSNTQLFFVASVTVALVSGSISTLGGIYHAFAAFVILNLLPIIFVFLSKGEDIFYAFGFAVSTYMFVMLKSGHHIHTSLRENIELKESFETRVDESTRELKEKEKLLYRQAKFAQMGEMISMIAHQWRQPLNAISATSAAINLKARLGKLDNDYVSSMTDNISEYAQHLSNTIDDFRNFFKPNKDKSKTSYNELLTSVLKIIEVSITSNKIAIVKELECKDSFISYPNELKQVILNLFKNAEDILIEKRIDKPFIKVFTYRENEKFILEVSDNAGGISQTVIDKIFDPYFSTKKQKDGTGLGLYMSKLIIEEHCSGELSVKNSSEGAVFKIILGEVI